MPEASMSQALAMMKAVTKNEPSASAQAATSASSEAAAIVIVPSTTSEQTSLTVPGPQLAGHQQRALASQRSAHAIPGEEIEIGVKRADDCRHRQAESRGHGPVADQQPECFDNDPNAATQHRGADQGIGDLLQFAGSEFKIGELAAMDPTHHNKREKLAQD